MTPDELLNLVATLLADYMRGGKHHGHVLVTKDGEHVVLFQSGGDHLAVSVYRATVTVQS